MKIALVITGLGMGGAENLLVNLADNLFKKGHDILILSLKKEILVLPKNNIKIISLDMEKKIDILFAYKKYIKIIKDFSPDIIHSHMYHANLLSRLIKPFIKEVKLITTSHSKYEGGKLRMFFYKATNFLSDFSTNVSTDAVQTFIDNKYINKNKILCIKNGIDTERFQYNNENRILIRNELNLENNDKMLLSIGRLDIPKDYPNMLKAYSFLIKENANFKAFIIGDGPEKTRINKLILEYNLSKNVFLLGIRNDIYKFYSACDLFILSSEWEGLPLVIAEAMSSECLIASTNCGGTIELSGDIFPLVPIKDSKKLYKKINESLNIPLDKKDIIKKASRKRIVDFFSIEKTTSEYLALYKKIKGN